jgi:hypothetical protein
MNVNGTGLALRDRGAVLAGEGGVKALESAVIGPASVNQTCLR